MTARPCSVPARIAVVGVGGVVEREPLDVGADLAGLGERDHLESSGTEPQYVVASDTS